jgi:glycosyltransferase involved in cell wall biosynthesis
MKLSVIVPVYNEKRTIDIILDKVREVDLGEVEREIIVVDGGSIDGTIDKLREQEKSPDTRVIYQGARLGRGSALKEGINASDGDIVIFQDADLELDPEDYPALLRPIVEGEAPIVFGSRFLAEKPRMGFLQYWGNKVINWSVNLAFGSRLTDVETCYQVFRRDALEGISLENNDFAFTVELTIKLIRSGLRIVEVPIVYIPRGRAEGKKVYWADGFAALWTIFKLRLQPAPPKRAVDPDKPAV